MHSDSSPYRESVAGVQNLYHYEASELHDIAKSINSQYSDLIFTANVAVQSFPDHTLRIQIENPTFSHAYEMVPRTDDLIDSSSTLHAGSNSSFQEQFYQYLRQPFLIQTKRGAIKSFFVHRDEPFVVTKLKRNLLHDLQLEQPKFRQDMGSNELDANATMLEYNIQTDGESRQNGRLQLIKQSLVFSPLETVTPMRQEYLFEPDNLQRVTQINGKRHIFDKLFYFAKSFIFILLTRILCQHS